MKDRLHGGAAWAAAFVAGLLVACVLLPAVLGLDPLAVDASLRLQGPTLAHPLGTDALGRDLLARMLVGGRISLAVAMVAALVSVGVGGALGLWAGYVGGRVDALVMRGTELFLALPKLPLLVLLTAIDPSKLGLSIGPFDKLVLLISMFGWMTSARLARAAVLPLRGAGFVLAAQGFGASRWQILRTHLLPHAAGPLLVASTLDLGQFIIYENVLSFLGLGILPPEPSWGALLAEAFVHLERAPMLVIVPGLMTFLTVLAFHRLGDGLRDALDPKEALE